MVRVDLNRVVIGLGMIAAIAMIVIDKGWAFLGFLAVVGVVFLVVLAAVTGRLPTVGVAEGRGLRVLWGKR